MKTTGDSPGGELRDVPRNTGATGDGEAIVTAISAFNRRRRLGRLAEELGTFDHFMSREQHRRLRDEG